MHKPERRTDYFVQCEMSRDVSKIVWGCHETSYVIAVAGRPRFDSQQGTIFLLQVNLHVQASSAPLP